jgi:hypothetical protein
MADTKHAGPHGLAERTEGDGISYKGVAWSMIILAIITLFCYALVVGFFKFMESRSIEGDTVRAPLAAPPVQPAIQDGRMVGGPASVPSLLVGEPMNLQKFRAEEEHLLSSYGWVDQNTGVVRLPIDRAKALLLERGLAVREGAPTAPVKHEAPQPGEPGGVAAKPAAPKPGGHK